MISDSGSIEIFEKEPEIFKLEDFNGKEVLSNAILCELKRENLQKGVELVKKMCVLAK